MARTPQPPKYPRTVPIGGVKVKIRVVKDMEDWGQYDHDNKIIKISKECFSKPGEFRNTLRHELIHAALTIGGVSYMRKFDDEPVVRCLDELFFPMWDKIEQKYELK